MAKNLTKYIGTLMFTDKTEQATTGKLDDCEEEDLSSAIEKMPSDSEKFLLQQIARQLVALRKNTDEQRSLTNIPQKSDDCKDSRPFYLKEPFPWTPEYANNRNYARELLHVCNQEQVMRWRKVKKTLNVSKTNKIAEGVYSEIFNALYKKKPVILKLIPIDDKGIDDCRAYSFREATAKVVVLKELAELSEVAEGYSTKAFLELKGVMTVKGHCPASIICEWKQYKRTKRSRRMNPIVFPTNQTYLLLAVENGGVNLNEYEIATIRQAYSIVYQLFIATAVAESRLSYEHRSLDIKNIFISSASWRETIISNIDGLQLEIPAHGVKVKIAASSFCRMCKDGSSIYFDWASNDKLFVGGNDFEHIILQAMRKINRNVWGTFSPASNILWLTYVINFIYNRLQQLQVGSEESRTQFFDHFKQLCECANIRDWIHDHIGTFMEEEINSW